jgi:uncharacterized membrane protein YbhN (UPF0104 family)
MHAFMSGLPQAAQKRAPAAFSDPHARQAATGRVYGRVRSATMDVSRLVREPARLRIRFFSSPSDAAQRARRPTDVVLVFVSLITIGLALLVDEGTSAFEAAITSFVTALPGLLGWFWEICDVLLGVWALTLVGAASFARGRRSLLRDQLLAVALAAVAGALLIRGGVGLLDGLTASGPPPIFPGIRLAFAAAVIATTSPHLGRPLRRIGRWLVPLASLSAIALGVASPIGVITGLAIGYGSAALVHLVFGSPGGRPTPEEVKTALVDLGIETTSVQDGALAPRGVAVMDASASDGRSLLVKVYGRDAWDGQLLNSTWSYLWYRDEAQSLTLSRLQQVEHEAFLTLLAERAGVPVLPVVAAGAAEEDAILVVETRGRFVAEVDSGEVSDAFVEELWGSVARLHEAGIAHGSLDDRHLVLLTDGSAAIGGFDGANAAATPAQVGADRAQLLVTTALRVGDDRAVSAAVNAIGPSPLAEALPFIQSAALTRTTRRSLKHADTELDALRERAAAAAGAEQAKLEPLRRVTWGSLLVIGLLLFGAFAIVSAFSSVGIDTLTSELSNAQAGWIWLALLVSPLVQVAEAFSTIGACPRPLRLGPVIGLQFAIRFIALAVPSSAARVALNVRFFQRAGLATSPSIAVGLVDSVAGFVVQVLLLVVIWLAGLASLQLSTSGLSLDISSQVIVAVVILVVVGLAVAVFVPRVRRVIAPRLAEAGEAIRVLRSPTKVFELFAGNLVAQVILAVVLGICLRAFGQHASLAELILINTLASLLAGVLPIPGGIGVMEAAISGGLVAVGIPESAAVAAAITFRLVTFYLPPIWGVVAMRILRRRAYI